MQTNQLKRNHPNTKRMIVARGGKRGKTSGRGGKGQTARAGNKRRPEWREKIKKLPKLRGRGKNSNKSATYIFERPVGVSITLLETAFNSNELVTPTTLVEKGIVATWSGRVARIKLLGGELTKALKISGCGVSESAKIAIEKAGGSIVALKPVSIQKPRKIPTGAPAKAEGKPAEAAKKPEGKSDKKADKKAPKAKEAKKEVKDATKPAKPAKVA